MFPKEILRGLPSGRVLDPVQGGHSLRGAGSGWTHGQATESCLGGEGGGGEALGGRREKGEKECRMGEVRESEKGREGRGRREGSSEQESVSFALLAAAHDLGRGVTPLGRHPSGVGSSQLLLLTSEVR